MIFQAPELTSTPPRETSFLFDDHLWASIGARQIHVRFLATYDSGNWVNRIGITWPSQATGPRGQVDTDKIALKMTNKKSRVVYEIVDTKHLVPAPPTKKQVECVPLQGDHRAKLATVVKINKQSKTASLVYSHVNSEQVKIAIAWDEPLDHLCWVE